MQGMGVYKYDCEPCRKSYVGETVRNFNIRHKEHMRAAETGKWNHFGLTQYMQNCNGPMNGPEILSNLSTKSKGALKYDLRVKEALYSRRFNCGPFKGLNEDMGSYVSTTQWQPIFNGI